MPAEAAAQQSARSGDPCTLPAEWHFSQHLTFRQKSLHVLLRTSLPVGERLREGRQRGGEGGVRVQFVRGLEKGEREEGEGVDLSG